MKPFFSIIIPVYKAEKYIHKCIDSILEQTFSDFELILVDDGSPDRTGEICDAYQINDNRISVIHKKNGGSSSARNVGIHKAVGTYLMFVDADDYWDDRTGLSKIRNYLEKKPVDYLRMACIDEYVSDGKRITSGLGYDKTIFQSNDKLEIVKKIFDSGFQPGAAWTAIIRRDVVIEKKLFFIEGIKGEDIDWILNVFLNVNTIDFCDICFYVYRKGRADSVTGTADLKSILDILGIIDKWKKEIKKEEYYKIHSSLNSYLAYHLMCMVILYERLGKEDKKIAKREIAKRKDVLKFINRKKVLVASILYRTLGIALSSKIMNIYH